MTTRYRTASVPTNTLKVNDIIIAHGGLFRVREVKTSQSHGFLPEENGAVHVNYCEYLGDASPDYPCQIPACWRDGSEDRGNPGRYNYWNQQGNGLARTCLVLEVITDLAEKAPVSNLIHAYEVEVTGQGNASHTVKVYARNRDAAARKATRAGYDVRSVNMVG
jgi:hypothetical protein